MDEQTILYGKDKVVAEYMDIRIYVLEYKKTVKNKELAYGLLSPTENRICLLRGSKYL